MSETAEQFIQAFLQSIESGHFVKCTLSKPVAGASSELKNVYLRPVSLKKGMHIAFNYRYQTRDEVKNYSPADSAALLRNLLGAAFKSADLFSTEADFSLQIEASGAARLQQRKATQQQQPDLQHDREKKRLIDPASPWLHAVGITSARGEVHAQAQDKWRQINKYLEIIAGLLRESPLPEQPVIADMGSGKGYLSFALYDYLKNIAGLQPRLSGIELRQQLVDMCNQTAQQAGFSGLHFQALDIREYRPEQLDMLIALHACDTATDLAIAAGIRQKARHIIVAPCCHKQIRKEMAPQNELSPLLHYGILAERQAEILTDGIRALLMEAEGYQTKVFEFISSEHTAKNVMITATVTETLRSEQRQKKREKALSQVAALKAVFGVKQHFLEGLLEETA